MLEGIKHGFRICDKRAEGTTNVKVNNHPSVFKFQDKVEQELKGQIKDGNYVIAEKSGLKPKIISPLGAIPKNDNEVRVIHDCSRPIGEAVNDYAVGSSVQYQTINEAYKLVQKDYYMCKVDLKAAYRSVAIHPDDYEMTGLCFKFSDDNSETILCDVRLPFGSSKGPMIFHRLSQAVKRMMYRRGFKNVIAYLDDFLIVEESYELCQKAQLTLLNLLVRLGFLISWKKVVSPGKNVEFLGVTIDSTMCTASLSDVKLAALLEKLKSFRKKSRASKRQLQSLAGSLNWACQVIQGGRYFLRRILDALKCLKLSSHKCKLSAEFHKDLTWWIDYSSTFNGVFYYREVEHEAIHTDACNEGAGIFFKGQWFYINWIGDFPSCVNLHINYKEVMAIILGLEIFAPRLANTHITVVTDNTAAKGILNKGRSRSTFVMSWLRRLFWVCSMYNISFRVIHVPGSLNQIPDSISRLHEPGQVLRLYSLLSNWSHASHIRFIDLCCLSMSPRGFQVVLPHLRRWHYRLS